MSKRAVAKKGAARGAVKSNQTRANGDRPIIVLFESLGRRKALRVIWELRSHRAMTFRDLAAACETNPSVLNTRLREHRANGFIAHAPATGYRLTDRGNELLGYLLPLYKWAERWALDDR